MRSTLKVISITSLVFFLATCKTSQRVTKTNLAYIYYDDPTIIHPEYKVFHESEDVTSLYLRLRSSEILYSKNNPEKVFLSRMVFQINVYDQENENKLITADTVFFYDKGGAEPGKYLVGKAELNLPSGRDYMAEITLDDQYRMQFVQDVIWIRKKDEVTEGHFLLTNLQDEVHFENYIGLNSALRLKVSPTLDMPSVKMEHFIEPGNLPPPPFGNPVEGGWAQSPDSTMKLKLEGRKGAEISFEKKGLYRFSAAPLEGNGISLLVLDPDYPDILTVSSMIRPLRYITTRSEYNDIRESVNQKKELDAFWYNLAGNTERAREIIKTYYSRVELANRFFTSDREGWRTDRGLIYIIYGPPNTVAKNLQNESWIYNEKNNMMSVEFNFSQVPNPYSDNDMRLNRSGGYKSSWYRAIDNWRQGRIF